MANFVQLVGNENTNLVDCLILEMLKHAFYLVSMELNLTFKVLNITKQNNHIIGYHNSRFSDRAYQCFGSYNHFISKSFE